MWFRLRADGGTCNSTGQAPAAGGVCLLGPGHVPVMPACEHLATSQEDHAAVPQVLARLSRTPAAAPARHQHELAQAHKHMATATHAAQAWRAAAGVAPGACFSKRVQPAPTPGTLHVPDPAGNLDRTGKKIKRPLNCFFVRVQ